MGASAAVQSAASSLLLLGKTLALGRAAGRSSAARAEAHCAPGRQLGASSGGRAELLADSGRA
jgi:hypothetical protein